MNILKTLFIALLLSLISGQAYATCSYSYKLGVLKWTINPGAIVVKGSDPIGKVLYTKSLSSVQTGKDFITCTEGETYYFSMYTRSAVAGMPDVYATNVPGIGIRVSDNQGRYFGQPGAAFPTVPGQYTTVDFTPLTFELIKTENLSQGGTLDSGIFMGVSAPGLGEGEVLQATMGNSTITTNNVCVVNSPVIQRDMGNDVSSTQFKNVGSTLQEKDITIELTCDYGTKISIKFDAEPVPGYPDIIALSSSPLSASGVGIQLLNKRNRNAIQLGTPLVLTQHTVGGPLSLAFLARYYQTSDEVMGGAVNATATFTMTYQ